MAFHILDGTLGKEGYFPMILKSDKVLSQVGLW